MTAATTPLTYNGYVNQIATLAVEQVTTVNGVVTPTNPALATVIPQALNYAELRIQRDLDIENLHLVNSGYTLTSGADTLTISADDFVTIETFAITVGTAKIPLLPVTRDFLQNVYGDSSYTAQPQYYAPNGGDMATAGTTSVIYRVGPFPDSNYPVTLSGLIRMPTLATYADQADAGTKLTFISTYYPDMLVMASMVYITAYQRQFGAASNDPQMGTTYESQYQTLLRGALGEEGRKRFQDSGWTSYSQPVVATPTR